ncbi:hypothetical protein VPNG_09636 [Cytospora leucostoma]|uniref:Uncharacterized protein n=1 Tax=Cytospora leucostoma TaxID=1230097 RepID=A0A423VQZ1_9PEZI|nr:hypothetical protein VPNG_09636 [Cytospora leucostoma]
MSNPGPNIYLPEEERPDYAPSDSSEDDDSDGDEDGQPGDDPAFEMEPTVLPMLRDIHRRLAGGEDAMPSANYMGCKYIFEVANKIRRFGIDERATADDRGRSYLTPIPDVYDDVTKPPSWVEDWQHFTFGGYTAAELKAQGAFDPEMDFSAPAHDSLQGGLHPFLARDKWVQPNFEGGRELDPYLHYIMPGTPETPRQFGRYDLRTNDVLWDAMQPALRLASKVLSSNPPFWQAIQDLYTRRPVEHRLVPDELEEGVSLTSVWLECDEDKMYTEARDLRRRNFDAAGITAFVLDRLLHLGFTSPMTTYNKECISGLTRMVPGRDFSSPCQDVVNVVISPELVWPLLVPHYSAAEKTAVSMKIACVLLHELADDPEAEEGFAFENSIWGGVMVEQVMGPEMGMDHGFPTSAHVNIHSWPTPAKVPHPPRISDLPQGEHNQFDTGWPKQLTEPPRTMIARQTAIPVAAFSGFFDESFWTGGGPFDKYGHQALRISTHQWEGRPLKSQYKFHYTREKDVWRAFASRRVVRWFGAAFHLLQRAKQYALAAYLAAKTDEAAERLVMRKRLHYEKKTWPRNDALLFRHISEIRRLLPLLPGLMDTYRRAKAGQDHADAPTMDGALLAYVEQARLIIIEASEIQRRLGIEVQYLQYIVLGILKQDKETRIRLRRYMDLMRFRIQSVLIRMADETTDAALTWVYQQFSDEFLPDIPPDPDTILHQRASRVTFMGVELMSTFPSTRQQLSDLAEVITVCTDAADDGELGSPPLDRFNLLVDGAGLRAMRTKQRDLCRLAYAHALDLRPGSPEQRIVAAWNGALVKQGELAQAANGEQRAAIRAELIGDILRVVGPARRQADENQAG